MSPGVFSGCRSGTYSPTEYPCGILTFSGKALPGLFENNPLIQQEKFLGVAF